MDTQLYLVKAQKQLYINGSKPHNCQNKKCQRTPLIHKLEKASGLHYIYASLALLHIKDTLQY